MGKFQRQQDQLRVFEAEGVGAAAESGEGPGELESADFDDSDAGEYFEVERKRKGFALELHEKTHF